LYQASRFSFTKVRLYTELNLHKNRFALALTPLLDKVLYQHNQAPALSAYPLVLLTSLSTNTNRGKDNMFTFP